METISDNAWCWLCMSMAVLLVTTFIMMQQTRQFFTLDVVVRHFSILDLEFPGSPNEIPNLVKGIYALPLEQQTKTLLALRGQLWVDFLFMPAVYGSIFLICFKVAEKMNPAGVVLFSWLAWLQLIPWLCDIIENIYLLRKIHPNVPASTKAVHKAYQWLEITKWGLSSIAAVCGLSALLFFWITGDFDAGSLHYLIILVVEIGVFIGVQLIPRQPVLPSAI
ncbi:MAG: hypothetical protein J7623_23185 [Chitinophaga sp.]|uniref:hypothetical protein n=1 Tax=Chitinophaga sp. TaxID=1869181 RepID=UPI001B2B9191|nr:hypothetical protein [Chitinophaga sp.]MBO9731564.1 hypothetical protein [Chitinophaga sp.]